MIEKNFATKTLKFIAKDVVLDVFIWPLWWYTQGVYFALIQMKNTIIQGNRELALSVWIKNIFVPMYGDYTWQGRLVSFLVRIGQIIGRTVLFLFWGIFAVIIFFLWLVAPVFVIYQLVINLFV